MKNTVILKWNPAISSYNMIRFLDDLVRNNTESDWNIWAHERVRKGDIFYMLKGFPGGMMGRMGQLIRSPFSRFAKHPFSFSTEPRYKMQSTAVSIAPRHRPASATALCGFIRYTHCIDWVTHQIFKVGNPVRSVILESNVPCILW